jgi:hypothetical protein
MLYKSDNALESGVILVRFAISGVTTLCQYILQTPASQALSLKYHDYNLTHLLLEMCSTCTEVDSWHVYQIATVVAFVSKQNDLLV